MKLKYSVVVSALVAGLSFTTVGCSGGSGGSSSTPQTGGGGGGSPSTAPAAVTSVSGLTSSSGGSGVNGSGTLSRGVSSQNEGSAELIVDANGNGSYNDSEDVTYVTPIVNGTFSFDNVSVDANESVVRNALLTVSKEGFAPYKQLVKLSKGNVVSVLAKMDKPVLTEVIDLSSLSKSQRASSFVRFGTKDDGSGVQSFSQLMSLSEFRAMADVNLSQDGTQSESIIPVGAFPSDVKKLTVQMQSFDSSNPDDFSHFPGALSGHGKPGLSSALSRGQVGDEVRLESAAFDLLKLTDQNGEMVDLQPVATSKLRAMTGRDVCGGMQWKRWLHSNEIGIIKSWGDDDSEMEGYQVPIWSNDNATGSWEYVGLATVPDINSSYPTFNPNFHKSYTLV